MNKTTTGGPFLYFRPLSHTVIWFLTNRLLEPFSTFFCHIFQSDFDFAFFLFVFPLFQSIDRCSYILRLPSSSMMRFKDNNNLHDKCNKLQCSRRMSGSFAQVVRGIVKQTMCIFSTYFTTFLNCHFWGIREKKANEVLHRISIFLQRSSIQPVKRTLKSLLSFE